MHLNERRAPTESHQQFYSREATDWQESPTAHCKRPRSTRSVNVKHIKMTASSAKHTSPVRFCNQDDTGEAAPKRAAAREKPPAPTAVGRRHGTQTERGLQRGGCRAATPPRGFTTWRLTGSVPCKQRAPVRSLRAYLPRDGPSWLPDLRCSRGQGSPGFLRGGCWVCAGWGSAPGTSTSTTSTIPPGYRGSVPQSPTTRGRGWTPGPDRSAGRSPRWVPVPRAAPRGGAGSSPGGSRSQPRSRSWWVPFPVPFPVPPPVPVPFPVPVPVAPGYTPGAGAVPGAAPGPVPGARPGSHPGAPHPGSHPRCPSPSAHLQPLEVGGRRVARLPGARPGDEPPVLVAALQQQEGLPGGEGQRVGLGGAEAVQGPVHGDTAALPHRAALPPPPPRARAPTRHAHRASPRGHAPSLRPRPLRGHAPPPLEDTPPPRSRPLSQPLVATPTLVEATPPPRAGPCCSAPWRHGGHGEGAGDLGVLGWGFWGTG